jgi:hypothetical protein
VTFRSLLHAQEARIAALSSVLTHCECGQSWPGHTIPPHKCRDQLGRDLEPMKLARAEGARRALRAVKNLCQPMPCAFCQAEMRAGETHICAGPKGQFPHEVQAANFVRQGTRDLLSEELSEVQKGER